MKLKLLVAIAIVCVSSKMGLAQTETEKDYKWGCSVAINSVEAQIDKPLEGSWGNTKNDLNIYGDKTDKSYSLSIIPKYLISSDVVLCLEIGITNIQLIHYLDAKGTSDEQIANETLNQKLYRYNAGIQKSLLKKKRIELYSGISINYTHYNSMNVDFYDEIRYPPSYTVNNWSKSNTTYPGGFAIGLGAFAGFNFYLQKHISLGVEFSTVLSYYKIGGEYSTVGTYQYLPSAPVQMPENTQSSLYKGFQFSKILSSFNVSIWF